MENNKCMIHERKKIAFTVLYFGTRKPLQLQSVNLGCDALTPADPSFYLHLKLYGRLVTWLGGRMNGLPVWWRHITLSTIRHGD